MYPIGVRPGEPPEPPEPEPPVLDSVDPDTISVLNLPQPFALYGSNLAGVTRVTWRRITSGEEADVSFMVTDDTEIQGVTGGALPAGAGAGVDFTAYNDDGPSNTVRAVLGAEEIVEPDPPAPVITSFEPPTGPANSASRTAVTMHGSGFSGSVGTIRFGTDPGNGLWVQSDELVSANTPFNQPPGLVSISFTFPGFGEVVAEGEQFEFVDEGTDE
jgi:hypothetical protein